MMTVEAIKDNEEMIMEEAMEVGADVRVNPLDEHTFVRGRRIFATIFAAGRGLIASLT